ncbi:MAG TPA: glycosyltransferase, partial [Acidimicrobiales bacterium]
YKTVHQDSAHAVSMFPATFGGFMQQRLRWARNSYRCYLTAAWKGWLWKQPLVTQVTVLQILLTPLTMGIAVAYLIHAFTAQAFVRATFYMLWFVVGRAIRGISHLREHPDDITLVPLMTVVTILLAVPLKVLAFVTMNEQGWLTRDDDNGPNGQSNASLDGHAILS